MDHDKLWKILKTIGVPEHLTCPLRNLYVGQEATVKTKYGTIVLFKIGKGRMLLLCLFHLDTEYIMQNARLDESEPGIKIEDRNINNLRYADHTTLMTESEEEESIDEGEREE